MGNIFRFSEYNQDSTEIEEKLSVHEIRSERDFEIKGEKSKDKVLKQDDTVEEVPTPTCDAVDETLVRNTSIEEAPSLESQHKENLRENIEEQHVEDNIVRKISTKDISENDLDKPADISKLDGPESLKSLDPDEKLSTLEDVVDKVVEFYITDKLDSSVNKQKDSKTIDEEEHFANSEMNIDAAPDHTVDEERAPSPTQSSSSSSRATRWEALADMAAELPPSLTVDPVTGQIYALAK